MKKIRKKILPILLSCFMIFSTLTSYNIDHLGITYTLNSEDYEKVIG